MASQHTSRYQLLPTLEDEEHEASPHERLLPTPGLKKPNNCWTLTLNPIVVLRALSTIFSIIVFIIFIIDGLPEFLAADICLACIMILNVLMLIHQMVNHLVRITVEVRQQAYAVGNGRKKEKTTMFLDLVFAVSLLICLVIGNSIKNSQNARDWWRATIIGYFVVLAQVLIAVPGLEEKSLTIIVKLNDFKGKDISDAKIPTQVSNAMSGADSGAQ